MIKVVVFILVFNYSMDMLQLVDEWCCVALWCFCDCPQKHQIAIQDPATPAMEGMLYFHNLLMFIIIFVGLFVLYMMIYVIYSFNESKIKTISKFSHNSILEIVWTILPAVILLFMAIPSFTLLYSLDELIDPQMTIKIIGHQWYWTYEISDFLNNSSIRNLSFDSYLVPEDSILENSWVGCRLLVSRPELVIPAETHIRLLVTSADVLHSWAVPSFGIKVDACPGRLSQASLYINRLLNAKTAVFFGQCSEICGINHGFMPITVLVKNPDKFKMWLIRK